MGSAAMLAAKRLAGVALRSESDEAIVCRGARGYILALTLLKRYDLKSKTRI